MSFYFPAVGVVLFAHGFVKLFLWRKSSGDGTEGTVGLLGYLCVIECG